jgi:FkbM family methyltransferase
VKIFVDVGAHFGQSSLKALNYKFGFDLVIAYEPSKRAQKRLARIKDSRLRIKPFALGGESGQALLYGTGFLGASLFPDKVGIVEPTQTESIDVKTAHQELGEFLIEGNSVWLKMNCEGSELAILRDLYAFNLLNKFGLIGMHEKFLVSKKISLILFHF